MERAPRDAQPSSPYSLMRMAPLPSLAEETDHTHCGGSPADPIFAIGVDMHPHQPLLQVAERVRGEGNPLFGFQRPLMTQMTTAGNIPGVHF